ncbi:MAG: hypothetical protein ACO29L_01805 [Candidatus Methylopumilus sp.]
MPSLYRFKDERIQDVMLAYTKIENSVRYSLTHGGRYMPYDEQELEMMREDKAWAMARLVIDKIMRLPPIEDFKPSY